MASRGKDEGGMPATGAGLIRYFDSETHGPKVSPKAIVGACIAFIIFEVLLHAGILV